MYYGLKKNCKYKLKANCLTMEFGTSCGEYKRMS